jgi:hypothetical protein
MKDKQKLRAAGLDRLAPLKPVGLEIRAVHWSAPAEALAVFGSGRLPRRSNACAAWPTPL